jgi:hypothetical protein
VTKIKKNKPFFTPTVLILEVDGQRWEIQIKIKLSPPPRPSPVEGEGVSAFQLLKSLLFFSLFPGGRSAG